MTPDQLRLLGELADWQLLGLVDAPDYWSKQIRDSHGCGSAKDEQWWNARLGRKTYPWGIAITTAGDYLSERKASDPAHVVTLTWRQITRWVESLGAALRADARRARAGTPEERAEVIDRLLGRHQTPTEVEELTLW
jgi:hypothetical protein